MRNKIILLGIVMLLLISSVSAFELDGITCSTNATDYHYYNDSIGNILGSSTYITIGTIADADNQLYALHVVNLYWDNYQESAGGLTAQGDANYISQFNGQQPWTDTSFAYWTTAWVDIPFESTTGLYYNLTQTFNSSADKVNYTMQNETNTYSTDWVGQKTSEDFKKIYLYTPTTGKFDGVYVWNCTLVSDDCGCPSGVAPTPESSSTINLSSPSPINESSFNVATVNFNLTANATYEFNCSIYLNDTINQTINEFPSGNNVAVDFNITFGDNGEYNYLIGCWDELNDTNTSSIVFFIDAVYPTITTDFFNNSVYYLNNLTAQFNFSDNLLLHTFNISIDNKLIDNVTHIHQTTYQYNLSWNVTNLSTGQHNLTVVVTDGHTAKELKNDYDWSNGLFNNYMKYDFVEGGYVKTELKDSSFFDSWTTTRLKDRYTQTFVPNTPTDTYTFVEESDQPIYIVNKPGHYNDHWIIIGTHWKDYVVKNEPESKVSIKRITANKVEVTVSGIKNNPGRLEFESIGDLNIVEQQYNFYVANATVTYSSPLLELTSQTMYLKFNKTSDINTNAVLYYNGSLFSTTKTSTSVLDTYSTTFTTPEISTAQENFTFYWQYDLYVDGTNETGNLTFNQTVNNILFDNCSTYTVKLINFTVKNETSGSAIIDNSTFITGNFKVWTTSGDNLTEFNISWGNNESGIYGLCAETAPINYTFDAQMEYGAAGFSNKLYYFNDYVVDNVTDKLDLFLTDGTTQVILTVKDYDDSVVSGAVIKVLSYDVGTDSFSTTEIVETDTNGEAAVQLILDTQFYTFIVEVGSIIKLQTLPTKITTTTKTLRIDLSDIKYFDRYDTTRGITHSLTWTNSSRTFSFFYSDPTGDVVNACLRVTRDTIGSATTLYDACNSSSTGIKLYTVTDNITDQTYTAVSYVKFSESDIYQLDTLTVSFEETFKKFGLTGIFVSFLLIITLVGVGIWSPVVAVLFAIFGLIIVSVLGIFSVGIGASWGALVGLIIMGGIIIYKLTKN